MTTQIFTTKVLPVSSETTSPISTFFGHQTIGKIVKITILPAATTSLNFRTKRTTIFATSTSPKIIAYVLIFENFDGKNLFTVAFSDIQMINEFWKIVKSKMIGQKLPECQQNSILGQHFQTNFCKFDGGIHQIIEPRLVF